MNEVMRDILIKDSFFKPILNVERVEQKLAELGTLIEVIVKINSGVDLKAFLTTVMESINRAMFTEAISLWLFDEKTEKLTINIVLGGRDHVLLGRTVEEGEGIAGYVAKTGEYVLTNDVKNDKRHCSSFDEISGFYTKSILCVPLKVKNTDILLGVEVIKGDEKVIGVIECINRYDRDFIEEDISILAAFASLIGVAIQNRRLYKEIRELFFNTIESLTAAIDAHDPYTHGHSKRVAEYALIIYEEMKKEQLFNISEYINDEGTLESELISKPSIMLVEEKSIHSYIEERKLVELAALLHDVGKLGIRDEVLLKPGKLTEEEYNIIKKHSELSCMILEPTKQLHKILSAVKHHHERYDGRGYPDGLAGSEIPLLARIIAIADSFDAMTSDRSYRPRKTDLEAFKEVQLCSNGQFDPEVVKAFVRAFENGKIKGQHRKLGKIQE